VKCWNLQGLVAAGAMLLASLSAHAVIINNGAFTTDTETRLDWLDVAETVNMSYNEVLAELGTGGKYDGWRYATGEELLQLINNFTGDQVTSYYTVNQETDKVDTLIQWLGSTLDTWYIHQHGQTFDALNGYAEGDGFDYTIGLISDQINSTYIYGSSLYDDDRAVTQMEDQSSIYSHNYEKTWKGYETGSFLVRTGQSIPEPPIAALIGIGWISFWIVFKTKHRSVY
jgi:hypothetical protein